MQWWTLTLSLATIAVAAATASSAGGGAAQLTGPPAGLTAYGRVVWNVDALLHDTFGPRRVYLNAKRSFPRSPRNFSTTFIDNAQSGYYIPTFENARGSTLKTIGPTKPPQPYIGGSGGEVPLTIRGAYIYCGHQQWLFEHYGNGLANWRISCHH
jgi:hypothetical protein